VRFPRQPTRTRGQHTAQPPRCHDKRLLVFGRLMFGSSALDWDELGPLAEVLMADVGVERGPPATAEWSGVHVTHAPHRFVVWRVKGHDLYLVEMSLHTQLKRNAVKIVFPAPITPSVVFESSGEGAERTTTMVVLTALKTLYRFTFDDTNPLDTDSILALLHMSSGFALARSKIEVFATMQVPHVARMEKALGDGCVALLLQQPANAVYLASLGSPLQPVQIQSLDCAAASAQAVCCLQRGRGDALVFVLHPDSRLSAYAVHSRTRVASLRLPSRNQVGTMMRIAVLEGGNRAVLSIVAGSALMQVRVDLAISSIDVELSHQWDLSAAGGAAVDVACSALGIAYVVLQGGNVLRCSLSEAGAATARLLYQRPRVNFTVPEEEAEWAILCSNLLLDGALFPTTFFQTFAQTLERQNKLLPTLMEDEDDEILPGAQGYRLLALWCV
jgi:hypothetical protein